MKKKCVLIAFSLLLCTFLGMNSNVQSLVTDSGKIHVTQWVSQLDQILTHVVQVEKITLNQSVPATTSVTDVSQGSEKIKVSYKLFGIFPLSSSEVEVRAPQKLIPCGQSIGVTLQSKGVMIVGQAPIESKEGKKIFPAKEAGLQVGDIILKIDEKEVRTDQDVLNAIQQAGKEKGNAGIEFKHQNQILLKTITPIYCVETGRYRIGLFVRDQAAGVGTLTFFDPLSNKYGALGHVINDADTNQKIEVANGKIMASTIYAIEKGMRGHPGEKVGTFVTDSNFTGTIEKNTLTGIFGTLKGKITNPYFKEAIPVGWESEVEEGPAKIYTVINGEKIEEFDISIERVMKNRTDSKNMILRVTDQKLLNITGGIIQGMSGSPIVQNGKLIGAVTHVFVNDSNRGYGVFIQNMLDEVKDLDKKDDAA